MLLELDAGESPDEPEDLWAMFDLLNIACGGHAGDEASMTRVVAFCAARERPRIGAHPSYPDRDGFGRRSLEIGPPALEGSIATQCAALAEIAARFGRRVEYVKPHGALYHDAAARPEVAAAVVRGAIAALGEAVLVVGPPAGELRGAVPAARYLREGFADRRMRPDGTLVPRTEPAALIEDPWAAAAQAVALARQVDALCLHGDTPGALAIARAVREALDA